MKALVCHHLSPDLSGVALAELPVPDPSIGEVRIRVVAASLNFPDLLMSQGLYQFKPGLPFTLGMECAGIVDGVGAGVSQFSEGDLVVGTGKTGAFAEHAVLPAAAISRKPAAMPFAQAAAFVVTTLTAQVALIRRANLQRGETLLVHGASGGVGMAAVQVGRLLGATVIATTASDAKLPRLLAAGAHHAMNVTGGFRDAVKALTGGRGADVILDPVGGDVFDESVRCVAFDGRLLVLGFTSGRIPSIGANLPLIKGFSLMGVRAGEYGRRFPDRGAENLATVWDWAAQGRVTPSIHAELPLTAWRQAFAMMSGREVVGKIVLKP